MKWFHPFMYNKWIHLGKHFHPSQKANPNQSNLIEKNKQKLTPGDVVGLIQNALNRCNTFTIGETKCFTIRCKQCQHISLVYVIFYALHSYRGGENDFSFSRTLSLSWEKLSCIFLQKRKHSFQLKQDWASAVKQLCYSIPLERTMQRHATMQLTGIKTMGKMTDYTRIEVHVSKCVCVYASVRTCAFFSCFLFCQNCTY